MQILCATDFSEPSVRATEVAAALARKLKLPLRLMHATRAWPVAAGEIPDVQMTEYWREKLSAEVARLCAEGVDASSELRYGVPNAEVAAAVLAEPTKLIVIGSTGRGMAERWLVGSVAERVAESAPVPTLVVRDADSLLAWLDDGKPLRVLCGVALNLSGDAALAAVKDLAKFGPLEVEAVHFVDEKESARSPASGKLGHDVWERVSHILGMPPTKLHVCPITRNADHEMARIAEQEHANLVVVGTHQRHGWQRLTAPSFSRGVLAHALTNVMCVSVVSYVPPFEVPANRRVLVATNFSTIGHDVVRHAFSLVPGGGVVRLLHVVKAPEPGMNPLVRSATYLAQGLESEKVSSAAKNKLNELLRSLPDLPGVLPTVEVIIHEDTAAAICEAAEKFDADVICVGAHNGRHPESAKIGKVAQSVIIRARCPVLVVPPAPL